jgi:hypothetical protein
MSFSEQYADELDNQRSAFKTSLEKRGYEDVTPSLPIGGTENEINALDDVTLTRDALNKNHNRGKSSLEPSVHSLDHESSVRRQPVERGLGAKFESELNDPSKQSSQVFSSFPLSQPLGEYHAAETASSGVYPYFRPPSSVHRESGVGEFNGEFNASSTMRVGKQQAQNVTLRDSKRPKERTKDKVYKQRFSMGSSSDMVNFRPNFAFHTEVGGETAGSDPRRTPAPSGNAFGLGQDYPQMPRNTELPPRGENLTPPPGSYFDIFLAYSGDSVTHEVWSSMEISRLMFDAGSIFGISPSEIALILFCGVPTSLQRNATISGPPRVTPGSTVMVFHVPGLRPKVQYQNQHVDLQIPAVNSKLLATFKLPKFDGNVKSWKQWEKSFHRFLGIHQLDHVLEESFLETLWSTPGAKAANKMVYFLVEDAVPAGTLASRLIRQATKWNGHEAFVLLRNGYVFNGPQTATILLAELSRVRLKRDEDASTFCFRLVELIEDLELIPGSAAVYLTDTQKLSYLLSAIRHENSLQSVYSQLQSEQLRGTVTFDQACQELHHRVEAMRADDYLDGRPGRALVSTQLKKNGQDGVELVKVSCLAKDCAEMVQPYLPLCKLCYLQCMAGKIPVLPLRDNLGNAVFNGSTKMLDFPAAVPKSRFPKKGLKKGKKVLMAAETTTASSTVE